MSIIEKYERIEQYAKENFSVAKNENELVLNSKKLTKSEKERVKAKDFLSKQELNLARVRKELAEKRLKIAKIQGNLSKKQFFYVKLAKNGVLEEKINKIKKVSIDFRKDLADVGEQFVKKFEEIKKKEDKLTNIKNEVYNAISEEEKI